MTTTFLSHTWYDLTTTADKSDYKTGTSIHVRFRTVRSGSCFKRLHLAIVNCPRGKLTTKHRHTTGKSLAGCFHF